MSPRETSYGEWNNIERETIMIEIAEMLGSQRSLLWDQVKQIGVIPAEKAFRSIADGGCAAKASK